jgi:Uma2 family endonuclease
MEPSRKQEVRPMSVGTSPKLMTFEEFEALPDDGVDRELIRGELREYPREFALTLRNQHHSHSMMEMGHALLSWLRLLPKPRGRVVGGEAGFRIRRNPDTFVGVDVAYLSGERLASTAANATYYEGAPNVAVEVLSPPDSQASILEKVTEYLDCGVELVLTLEPVFRTVTAYRPGSRPELFSGEQILIAEDVLPGFRVPVADLFS